MYTYMVDSALCGHYYILQSRNPIRHPETWLQAMKNNQTQTLVLTLQTAQTLIYPLKLYPDGLELAAASGASRRMCGDRLKVSPSAWGVLRGSVRIVGTGICELAITLSRTISTRRLLPVLCDCSIDVCCGQT